MTIEDEIVVLWRIGSDTHEIASIIGCDAIRESTVYHVINDWLDRGHKQKFLSIEEQGECARG